MRIIAGSLSGRSFDSPHGHRTHPMSERVRGALFNVLGDVSDLRILDAFAGSGALSFEAVSRGAASALALESERLAQRTIADNIAALELDNVKLIKASAGAWLRTTDDMFDVVLLDPPYDSLQPPLLTQLAERTTPGGLVVLSLPPRAGFTLPPDHYQLVTDKSYGDAELMFYRHVR